MYVKISFSLGYSLLPGGWVILEEFIIRCMIIPAWLLTN